MTNLEELKKLSKKVSGKESNATNIAEALSEIEQAYSGGGGSGVTIESAELYPDSADVIQGGAINMSDGTVIDMYLNYIDQFQMTCAAGATSGTTTLNVTNELAEGHSYVYELDRSPNKPAIGEVMGFATTWDGVSDIACSDGQLITLVEVDSNNKAVKAAIAPVNVAS